MQNKKKIEKRSKKSLFSEEKKKTFTTEIYLIIYICLFENQHRTLLLISWKI